MVVRDAGPTIVELHVHELVAHPALWKRSQVLAGPARNASQRAVCSTVSLRSLPQRITAHLEPSSRTLRHLTQQRYPCAAPLSAWQVEIWLQHPHSRHKLPATARSIARRAILEQCRLSIVTRLNST